ncbi:MAG TPA: basic secretory protein-like protein [Gemmatimonadales bacterium]|nr:basic secretory protein-like protein [Gemmatimonadales bacterium]
MPAPRGLRRAGALALAALGIATAPAPATAQYFGRNKVRYEAFRFELLRTKHFEVYFYPEEAAAAPIVARMAERWYVRHAAALGHQLRGTQTVIVYASHPHFEQTNAIDGDLSEGTGGVTEALKRRIVMPLAGPLAETDHVLGHELVHAFQYDITGQGRGGLAAIPTAARLPLWFIEGMAEYLSLGPVDPNTAMWLRDAARQNRLPNLRQLEDPRYFPYRYGQAFLAYLAARYGDQAIGDMLRAAGRSGDVAHALAEVTGTPPDTLAKQWHAAVRAWAAPVEAATRPAATFGRILEGQQKDARMNIAPAVSPDGRRVAFFSDRGLFAVELYLADAVTGKVERSLVRTAVDAHYESLEFITSSGAWDATGRRFAFGAVAKGRPILTVLDVERDRIEREIPLPALGEIFTPTWSPDGRAIAFSALAGGVSDLFVYDLGAGALRRVTADAFADLQPAWSPDGRTIAFVTDRFSTTLPDLRFGAYRLALYDVATGRITPLPGFPQGKHINPQWSPDGAHIYFVSDHDGISNVYRLDVVGGMVRQVTDVPTGASGITALSPVISVAQRGGRLVFTAYEGGVYRLYAIDGGATLAGSRPVDLSASRPAVLPPADAPDPTLLLRLADAETGLPPDTAFPAAPYHPKLSLSYVAPPTLAVGADRYGAYVGGGTALYFSDLLGDHNLVTGFQVNGGLKDLSALLGYQNQSRRLNWGAVVQQVPYVTGNYAAGFVDTTYVEQVYLQRQTNRSISGLLAYPFSRVQRVEMSLGYERISFDQEVETRAFSLNTGLLVYDSTVTLPSPAALNLMVSDVALVYDNSYFGATSPVLGQRYRLDVQQMTGSITTTTAIADYRRYLMPVRPWTIAARLLHVGRYGRDAEDPRLGPLFLGYPGLVRGYDNGSFDPNECPAATTPSGCPVFDRLLGSRMLLANAELRFPLFGVLGIGGGYYGAFPLEAAIFADAGVAWTQAPGDKPTFLGGNRPGVSSAGVALRANLFGYAIGELDVVKPFQRPGKGWLIELNLIPGF